MKKVLFISALVLTTSFAFSQTTKDGKPMEKGNWEERQQQFKDKMAKELNLSKDQINQINAIDDKYKPQEENLRTQSQALRDQKRQLMDQKKTEVEKILTPEQKQKLQDMKDKFHDKRMQMHKKDGPK